MIAPMTSFSPDHPEYRCPAYQGMQARWQRVRDIRGGTETIQLTRELYLPRFEAEEVIDYNARVQMTFSFDALDETIHAMVGLAMRNDPALQDDVPPEIQSDWENLDGQRTHGAVFAQHTLEHAIQDGHAAILVDYPPADPARDLPQEQALGLRPYAVQITIDQITAWRTAVVGGKLCVAMVKLEEYTEMADGAFGVKTVKHYRIYRQQVDADGQPYVTLEVQEEATTTTGTDYLTIRPESPLLGPKWIPLFIVYGGEQAGILLSKPPLRGLANSNLDHTQVKSDRRFSMHKCAIPIPVFIGRQKQQGEGGKIAVGPSWGIDIAVGGDAHYMESTGSALAELRQELQDIELRMGSQGFDMMRLDRPNQANQTATAARIQKAKGESKLSRAVRSLEDALEGALQAFADFRGIKTGGGSVLLQHEFAERALAPEELRILMDLEAAGELTLPTLLEEIQKGGRLLQGVDLEAEVKAVELKLSQEPAVQPAPSGRPAALGPDGQPLPMMPPKPGETATAA
jgi:hypothetical protein